MMSAPVAVDVLAVMKRALILGLPLSRVDDMAAATAAVAELIEAVAAHRKGEYHDPETEFSADYRERRRKEAARVDAALARVGGAA